MLRAGLHHGEAATRGGQFYGTAVNVAARIAGYARGGQVLCSETVLPAARAAGVPTQSLGRVGLKNLREPLELFALGMDADLAARTEYWFCSRECLGVFLRDAPPG